tara:strand:+ start:31277 stop:31435 length:159 start_codon:yes stop_codon:yes gene_type:complete
MYAENFLKIKISHSIVSVLTTPGITPTHSCQKGNPPIFLYRIAKNIREKYTR